MPFTDYPQAMTDAAVKGRKLNEERDGDCATPVGKRTARILANRETISDELLKDMYTYLQRAEEYYNPEDESACGTISFLLWGGKAAQRWSEKKWKEMEENRTVTDEVDVQYNVPHPQKREQAEKEAAENCCDSVHSCSCGGYVPVQTERSESHDDGQVQQRTHMANFEVREDSNGQPVIRGYAAVFDAPTRIGNFTEVIARGAFDEVMHTADVRALFNHDPNMILARRHSDGSGTLKLSTDEHGLAYEFTPGTQSYARDLVESMKRGDINASSFAFTIEDQEWSDDHSQRTVQKVGMLLDIAPVTYPAYPQTSAALRSEDVQEPEKETSAEVRSEAPQQPEKETIQTNPYNMKNSNELKELRGKHTAEFEAINAAADADGRNLTDAESQRCDFLNAEILRIDDKLKRAIQQEEMTSRMAQMGGNAVPSDVREAQKVHKQFSIARAAAQLIKNGKLEGAEAEWKQESDNEAQRTGIHLEGNVGIPQVALRAGDADNFQAGGTGDGSGFVATNVGGAIAALREPSMIERMGATVITGATGNVKFPRISNKAAAAWETEVAAGDASTMAMDDLTLTPKRVGCVTTYSKQLLIQGGASVDSVIASDIALAINNAIDTAAFAGSGASGQPTGILATSGVFDNSTADANTTDIQALVTQMEADLIGNGASVGAQYVFSPTAMKLAKGDAMISGVTPLWDLASNTVNGYGAVQTGYLADSTTDVGQIVFGNFQQLLLVYFGAGLDLLIDPFTAGANAQVKINANRFVDLAVRQPGAFSICTDVAAS